MDPSRFCPFTDRWKGVSRSDVAFGSASHASSAELVLERPLTVGSDVRCGTSTSINSGDKFCEEGCQFSGGEVNPGSAIVVTVVSFFFFFFFTRIKIVSSRTNESSVPTIAPVSPGQHFAIQEVFYQALLECTAVRIELSLCKVAEHRQARV